MKKRTIFIFRQDLRLSDNPGLYNAALNGDIIPVYILDKKDNIGSASKCWLYYSLLELNKKLGFKLNFYKGDTCEIILRLVQEHNAEFVYWNRCYEPWRIKNDKDTKSVLATKNIECKTFNSSLLWEPWNVLKPDKTAYKVFTPYYKNGCLKSISPRQIIPNLDELEFIKVNDSLDIEQLELLSAFSWNDSKKDLWKIGEDAAQDKLYEFLDYKLKGYKEGRNFPNVNKISKLSPHLHFGEISSHQIWHATKVRMQIDRGIESDANIFLTELAWREFSYYLLYHFPDLPTQNFQKKFDNFPWQYDSKLLKAWQIGQTGYPIVDAGMRELMYTGFMHNRVRMIVGSFLVKNLLIHWQYGASWFFDNLVDADLANNSASWQWVAGSGADAAPYFRIFNPITQGEKFDFEGEYTRNFVPELELLPNKYLFSPWEAPEEVLIKANIKLGETYPNPIVDIKDSRERALASYSSLKRFFH